MLTTQQELTAVENVEEEFAPSITFLNLTGDVTITWDAHNAEKIKALVRDQMAKGVTFFTLRKVVIEAVKVKRKIGAKGIDTIDNLVIDDAQFDRLVAGVDDKELAKLLISKDAKLAKRTGKSREFVAGQRAKDADEVLKARQAVAVRPVLGG